MPETFLSADSVSIKAINDLCDSVYLISSIRDEVLTVVFGNLRINMEIRSYGEYDDFIRIWASWRLDPEQPMLRRLGVVNTLNERYILRVLVHTWGDGSASLICDYSYPCSYGLHKQNFIKVLYNFRDGVTSAISQSEVAALLA